MDLEEKNSSIEALNKQFEEQGLVVLELRKKIGDVEERNNSLRKELEDLSSQLDESLSNEEKSGRNIQSLNEKVEKMEVVVSEQKQKLVVKEEQNEFLKKELDNVNSRLTESLSTEEKKESCVDELQQNIQVLEAQLLKETDKSGSLSAELVNVQSKMNSVIAALGEKESEIADLRESKVANEDKVSKLTKQLDDKEKTLNVAESEKMKLETQLKNAEIKIGESIMQVDRERESVVLEWSRKFREKSEECVSATEQLQKSKEEVLRLKDMVVHLENVSSSKDQEKLKMEKSYEAFSEKMQGREDELLKACKDLEEEKTSLLEKTRDCQATMEALRHECKVHQQECKKACELADCKAQEYRDVVDKLDDSQKHLQDARHQLSRAESELRDFKEELQQARLEKSDFLEKIDAKNEEHEAKVKELQQEVSSSEAKISKLTSQLESSDATARVVESEKRELEEILTRTQEELGIATEKSNTFANEKNERELMMRSDEETEKMISLLKEQVQSLEVSRAELKCELENAKDETNRLKNTANCLQEQQTSAMTEKDLELKQMMDAMRDQENLAMEKLEKLQKELDSRETKAKEMEERIEETLLERRSLSSSLEEKTAELIQLNNRNLELENVCEKLKQEKENVEDRLALQSSKLEDMSSEKARLCEEIQNIKDELEMTKSHAAEQMTDNEGVQVRVRSCFVYLCP